jgi:hypothetical protein
MFTSTAFLALAGAAAGSVLWDGRLNNYTSAAFLDDWSWSNQVGPYQYYIHGSGSRDEYVAMSTDYKNPADTGSEQGLQITIDDTSSWNGQTMMRTELIPQTTAAINTGKVFYHFSMQHTGTNPPSQTQEHQVCFFESHFTEMKYGLMSGASGTSSNLLHWYVGGDSQWNVTFEAGEWHNIAYGIDFDAQTVTFYHSTGAEDLAQIAGPISASTSSNGADWHLGVLRLASSSGGNSVTEDWHFSGVYIEDGDLTKSVSGPGASSDSSSAPATTASPAATAASRQATTFQTQVKPASSTFSSTALATSSSPSAVASNPALIFSGSLPTTSASSTATFVPVVSSYAAALSSAAAELTSESTVAATTTPAAAETDDCEVVYAQWAT